MLYSEKDKNLDKFEARSIDGSFFGYAFSLYSISLLNLETNQIVETCEVTFDETQPHSSLVFDCAEADELGEEILGCMHLYHMHCCRKSFSYIHCSP
jgi:hypothetical protein